MVLKSFESLERKMKRKWGECSSNASRWLVIFGEDPGAITLLSLEPRII
jgi:hypothetical protein